MSQDIDILSVVSVYVQRKCLAYTQPFALVVSCDISPSFQCRSGAPCVTCIHFTTQYMNKTRKCFNYWRFCWPSSHPSTHRVSSASWCSDSSEPQNMSHINDDEKLATVRKAKQRKFTWSSGSKGTNFFELKTWVDSSLSAAKTVLKWRGGFLFLKKFRPTVFGEVSAHPILFAHYVLPFMQLASQLRFQHMLYKELLIPHWFKPFKWS